MHPLSLSRPQIRESKQMLLDMDSSRGARGPSDEQFRRSSVGQLRTEHALFLRLFCGDDGSVVAGKELAKARMMARRADAG